MQQFIIVPILLLSLSSMFTFAYCSSSWSTGEQMRSKGTEISAVSLADNIYAIGGQTKKGTTNLVQLYNTEADSWKLAAPLPEKRDHVAAATYDNKIYVIGGFSDRGVPTADLFIYDPITNKWQRGSNMPTPRGALTANFINGILYAIGGDATRNYDDVDYEPQGAVATNEAYDPNTNTWTTRSPMEISRHHMTSAVIDEKIYVIGGREPIGNSSLFRNLAINEMYDPKHDTWVSRQPLPSYRSGLAAAAIDDKIYVFGGENTQRTFDNNEEYNPKTDSWTLCVPMPTARHGLGAITVDGNVYVIGGNLEPAGSGDNKNEIFNGNC